MVTTVKKVPTLIFGLMVVAALVCGAKQALAASPVSSECPNDGSTFLGSCTSTGHC